MIAPLDPELARVFATDEKFEERERRTHAAVVLESEEVLVWWAMERNETVPQTRLFFERQLAGYHDPDTYFLTTAANNKFRESSYVDIDSDSNDSYEVDDTRDNDACATLTKSSKELDFDDERLYKESPPQSPSTGVSRKKHQEAKTRQEKGKQKQKQQRKDSDDNMIDDEDNGGVGIANVGESAAMGASADKSRMEKS